MFALRKDERKLLYSRGNILGFINTGYFKSDNVPDGFKKCNAQYIFEFLKKAGYRNENIQLFSEMAKTNKRLFNI
jgi:adenosylcobinamide amidohydrolase